MNEGFGSLTKPNCFGHDYDNHDGICLSCPVRAQCLANLIVNDRPLKITPRVEVPYRRIRL